MKTPVNPLPEIPSLKNEGSKKSGADDTLSGSQFDKLNGSKIALRTEEEQQAAAREREERERRDARRKSLANRRVSFAAEATLHTFHDIEYMQDKAASSRRRSSVSNNAGGSGNDRSLGSRSSRKSTTSSLKMEGITIMEEIRTIFLQVLLIFDATTPAPQGTALILSLSMQLRRILSKKTMVKIPIAIQTTVP